MCIAYYSLIASMNAIAGETLSLIEDSKLRAKAALAKDRLREYAKNWSLQAAIGENSTELLKVRTHEMNLHPSEMLKRIFYIRFVGYYFALANLKRPNPSRQLLRELTGYTALCSQLGRPTSRPQFNNDILTIAMFCEEKRARKVATRPRAFTVGSPRHKTAKSYGALVAKLHPAAVQAMDEYIQHIVPQLRDEDAVTDASTQMFPHNVNAQIQSFLSKFGLRLNLSSIRNLVSGACEEIKPTHPLWGMFLELCLSSSMLVNCYILR